jgi:predicted SAM-dependent methyltransferase
MDWLGIQTRDPIFLNLGGGGDCHPRPGYLNYISVDISPPDSPWAVKHDLRHEIPLGDASVMRIHCEDVLEHVTAEEIGVVLAEGYRLLRPGGLMRIGVPDYNNPKDRPYLDRGSDPRRSDHATLTTYALLKEMIEQSPFTGYEFHHYWVGSQFVQHPIDYSLGMIKRTPDNDPRSRRMGLVQNARGYLADLAFGLSHCLSLSEQDWLVRRGHRLYVTSLVVDLFKR